MFYVVTLTVGSKLRDRNGRTYESIGLRPNQIMVLHFEPVYPNSKAEMLTNIV
ncbi:hypothetical protein [Argonema galeatum]|uniref:hypothetical protein n=1 Tax=Argonema galeatum TaxID=2942762 RepID=UPI002011F0F8|nr:hypothetical protein [Argonema galeatum]MCL1466291.1 hypothetical protein [Argonema galeatum A003/A1]